MKLLFDFLPVVLFFLAYKGFAVLPQGMMEGINQLTGLGLDTATPSHAILFATLVAILIAIGQNGFHRLRHGRFERMHLISMGLLVLVGVATLLLRDPIYFMWKPTLVNGLFALILLGSRFFGEKTLIERMMGNAIAAPTRIWQRLNSAWAGFFLFSALANLYVAYHFSEAAWVNFKLFGLMGLMIVFIILQAFYLALHMQEGTETTSSEDT